MSFLSSASSAVCEINGLRTHHDPNKTGILNLHHPLRTHCCLHPTCDFSFARLCPPSSLCFSVQDKLLFTPGPLTTSHTVKQAMMTDLGSRDHVFLTVIRHVQSALLELACVDAKDYACIPMQGSGTFGVESVISSVVDKKKGLLVIANGAYGVRIASIAKAHGVHHHLYSIPDDTPPSMPDLAALLSSPDLASVSHVAVVHSETTSGIINDINAIGQLAHQHGKQFIVDAMSSFGAVPISFSSSMIDYLVSSANKCVEGVPGFAFVIARRTALASVSLSTPSSLSLNLMAQLAGLEKDGQFRFTPPTHALLAFSQALKELQDEGGVMARMARYKRNQAVLMTGLCELGFNLYLKRELQGWIISGYRYPSDPNWDFGAFHAKLNDRGFVIYPGKVSSADCFRIGHIGRIFEDDTRALVQAIDEVCKEMKTGKYAHE